MVFLGEEAELRHLATAPTPAEPAHLSIVVLPFTNLSGDPAQDYFADGITENLTTELSRIRNSFVIARNTAFSFKGKNVDARRSVRKLGVRYVLEGSVQRDQGRVRVNAQLIDAGSGAHLWADRFEENVADLFKLQDQVVARLANSLGYELVKTEAEEAPVPKALTLSISPCAVGPWCGRNSSSSGRSRTTMRRKLCSNRRSRPTRTKPMRWWAMPPRICWNTRGDGTTAGTDYEAKILGQANRAIALAPRNVWAYNVKSLLLTISAARQMRGSAQPTPDSPLIRMTRRSTGREAKPNLSSAVTNKRYP